MNLRRLEDNRSQGGQALGPFMYVEQVQAAQHSVVLRGISEEAKRLEKPNEPGGHGATPWGLMTRYCACLLRAVWGCLC